MSLYGEPHSPERLAFLRAKRAYSVAPRGWQRFAAGQAMEVLRKEAVRAAQAQRARQLARERATTPKGSFRAKTTGAPVDAKPENPNSPGVLVSGVQGARPFSTRYRVIETQTQKTTELFGKGSKPVPNGNRRCTPLKPRHCPTRRYRLGRPVIQSKEQWTRGIADELNRLGWSFTADSLLGCGSKAQVWNCQCGFERAAIGISTTCGLRVCPWCARRDSQKRTARLGPALELVEHFTETRRQRTAVAIDYAILHAQEAFDFWFDKYQRAKNQNTAMYCAQRAAAARERELVAAWQSHRVRDDRWQWRLDTLSPQWNPKDSAEYRISGLKERLADVRSRWDRVWRQIRTAGMSSAVCTTEISENGHIHIHAMVYGAYVTDTYLRELAGCSVDVREIDESKAAVKEVAKYTAKLVSPLSGQWIAGQRRRVIHPELAARWMLATRKTQLKWNRGAPLRDAFEVTREPDKEPCDSQPLPVCLSCQQPITTAPETMDVRTIAREQSELAEAYLGRLRAKYLNARIAGMAEHAIPWQQFKTESERTIERVRVRRFFWASRLHITHAPRPRPSGSPQSLAPAATAGILS